MKACYTYLLLLSLSIIFSGCNLNSSNDNGTDGDLVAELINKTWELRSIQENGYGTFAPERDSMYTITFKSDSTFSAYDICNYCGGSYWIENNEFISFDGFFCTEMACQDYRNAIPFSSLLGGNTFPISFQDDELYINVDEENDFVHQYVFGEYSSTKNVIMANPDSFNNDDWPSGIFNILESDIEGDTLSLRVGYSGCGPHELNLVFNNYFMESIPVQAYAMLSHPEEPCDAYFETEETFDLTPLKEEYLKYYGDEGMIDISLIQNGNKEVTFRYGF